MEICSKITSGEWKDARNATCLSRTPYASFTSRSETVGELAPVDVAELHRRAFDVLLGDLLRQRLHLRRKEQHGVPVALVQALQRAGKSRRAHVAVALEQTARAGDAERPEEVPVSLLVQEVGLGVDASAGRAAAGPNGGGKMSKIGKMSFRVGARDVRLEGALHPVAVIFKPQGASRRRARRGRRLLRGRGGAVHDGLRPRDRPPARPPRGGPHAARRPRRGDSSSHDTNPARRWHARAPPPSRWRSPRSPWSPSLSRDARAHLVGVSPLGRDRRRPTRRSLARARVARRPPSWVLTPSSGTKSNNFIQFGS